MFRRRRSSSHHQPLSTSSSQSAQSAATHAFLKSQPSSSSLSSAAAAAALRSLTPTPQPVENVQTRRMQRRGSVASQTSLAPSLRSNSRNGLRRTTSSSSMSSRTFREPSPHRPATSSGPVLVAPPIPSIPPEYAGRKTQTRRSVSLEPPMRPISSPKRAAQSRGISVDPGARMSTGQPYGNRASGLGTVPELERSTSRNSVNFSYPMGARPSSPASSPSPYDRRDVSTGTSLAQLSSAEVSNIQNQPIKKPAKKESRGLTASNSEKGQSVGTAVAAAQAAIVPSSTHSTPTRPTASRDNSDHKPSPSRPAPKKQAPAIHEDNHREERAELGPPAEINDQKRVDSPSPIDRFPIPVEQNENILRPKANPPPKEPLAGRVTPNNDVKPSSLQALTPESKRLTEMEPETQRSHVRGSSTSPGRSARFSNRLSVTGIGDQLHQPPPRSVSPVKSAMKQSGSPKGSLSPERRTGVVLRPGPALSEISDGTSVASDDGSRVGARRKPAKVSFDDEAEVVGVAASPPTSPEEMLPDSPQARSRPKNSWFGVGKRKPVLSDNYSGDEFDEVMKPRPALPSFGSIRAGREPEKQNAIKEEKEELSDNESTASSGSNVVVSGWSFSNDHAIGGILRKPQPDDDSTRHAGPNHEPMPTIPDAVETPSYAEKLKENLHLEPSPQVEQVEPTPEAEKETANAVDSSLAMPAIAVQPATPEIEKDRPSLEWYDVPGGFPRTSLDSDPKAVGKKKGKKSHKRTESGSSISYDESGMPVPSANHSDSSESVYSDAAEDMDGDGFGSINAIVDSRQRADADPFVARNDDSQPADPPVASATEDVSQIGRAVSPEQEEAIPQVPDSPDSAKTPLPFSSPYPPFPIDRKGGVARSNTTSKNTARPMSMAHSESMPAVTQRNGQEPKKRPVSLGPTFHKGKDAGQNGDARVNGRGANIMARPTSSGSDSSSSFKRTNRSPKGDGPFAMRRTMRGSPRAAETQSPPRSPGSPTERPMSSGSNSSTPMRMTLRGNGLPGGKASFFSTGKPPRGKISKVPMTKFSSTRFDDSDDEVGGNQPRNFQSRFKDSSDEEGPASNSLRPVRGIPRRQGTNDGDSTELEDSSEEERRQTQPSTPAKKQNGAGASRTSPLAAVAKTRGVSEQDLEEFLHQPNRGRMSGLFSRLSTKKKPKNTLDNKIRKSTLESPSRRDTPLERSQQELDQIREEAPLGISTTVTSENNENDQVSSSPKLSKRNTRRMASGDKWSLVQEKKNSNATEASANQPNGVTLSNHSSERPQTADGVVRNGSALVNGKSNGSAKDSQVNGEGSHFGNRDSSALDVPIESTGRKKRFPMLRKAFGLRS